MIISRNRYFDLLRKSDQSLDPTYPDDFDFTDVDRRARELNTRIQSELRIKTTAAFGDTIQDAPYHTMIRLHDTLNNCFGAIRLSNFGNLATILLKRTMDEVDHSRLIKIIESCGFNYVPLEILHEPYDGIFEGVETWFRRYFEYFE